MNRRDFFKTSALIGGTVGVCPLWAVDLGPELIHQRHDRLETLTLEQVRKKLPENVPHNIAAVIRNTLNQKIESIDSDWQGCFRVEALLKWNALGLSYGLDFGKDWFEYHLEHDRKLTDEQFLAVYDGGKSRVIRNTQLLMTTYIGHYSQAFACYELYKRTGDPRARQSVIDVAETILYEAPRNQYGMIAVDDKRINWMVIPDSAYFIIPPLLLAANLDDQMAHFCRKTAVIQIMKYSRRVLDREAGLALTATDDMDLGKCHWSRAQGWLVWAYVLTLRNLPPDYPGFDTIAADLKTLVDGVAARQRPSGALPYLVSDPSTEDESSGIAMCAAGAHEAVRKGWLPDKYSDFINRGWKFVISSITDEGRIKNVYCGGAHAAAQKKKYIDSHVKPFIPGLFLIAAYEMYK